MCLGLAIYIGGARYLPRESLRPVAVARTGRDANANDDYARKLGLLLTVIAIVVVFRGAYEQIGNTVALWADSGVDRHANLAWTIPSTWFQALNPLLVFTLTPVLLAIWSRRAQAAPLRRMATGAAIVALGYALLALTAAHATATGVPSHWLWLVAFFVVMTTGELFILPTGLALFGRLAPGAFAATTIALWFSASFAGNLLAGGLGSWWTQLGPTRFFLLVTIVAAIAALLLRLVDAPAQRVLGAHA
jgi:POT family proton-dependent oligopeptide transporter